MYSPTTAAISAYRPLDVRATELHRCCEIAGKISGDVRHERITTLAAVGDGKYSEMISWHDAERCFPVDVCVGQVTVFDMFDEWCRVVRLFRRLGPSCAVFTGKRDGILV
jgi:hypothetical protein